MAEPVVGTTAGKLRGFEGDGYVAFLGVHYGAPTGGSARFLPPAAAQPWTGIRDAMVYGPSCPQIPSASITGYDSARDDPVVPSEDCLVLNVWTPAVSHGPRPVMVFFHGGGLHFGSGNNPLWAGDALARRGDVVVVTVNHRLGALGFTHLTELMGPEYAASGNAGLLDLVAALTWVRDNIGAFGGDPGNVTIFGQSGGGQKVSCLMTMPAAQGLFHKAAVQSGSQLRVGVRTDPSTVADFVLGQLGVAAHDTDALAAVAVDKIVVAGAAAMAKFGTMVYSGTLDGVSFPKQPVDLLADGAAADVPLLVGVTSDEFRNLGNAGARFTEMDDAALGSLLSGLVGGADGNWVDEPLARYRARYPGATPAELVAVVFNDFAIMCAPHVAEAKLRAATAPVYSYLFSWGRPGIGAPHGSELTFLFDHLNPALPQHGATIRDQVLGAWVAFARSGDPNHAKLPEWTTYELRDRAMMRFDDPSRLELDPIADIRAMWDGVDTVH